jgi:hypothetical protein
MLWFFFFSAFKTEVGYHCSYENCRLSLVTIRSLLLSKYAAVMWHLVELEICCHSCIRGYLFVALRD